MACAVETTRVSLEDCTCPICMCILIEPVTMPCHHELCRPCFKQNVEEASLLCPMCRTRIGTWARHATKTKTLVNQTRWEQIQELFPKRVRLRLEGKDEEDDTNDVTFHPPVHLAAPGEIRKEYEEELKKLRQQLVSERKREELESEALIRRLQEEEEAERARQQNLNQIHQHDEILARELGKVINEAGADEPIDLLLEESRARLTRSSSVASNKSEKSTCGPLDTFFSKGKSSTEPQRTSPYPYPCISPSDKEKLKGGGNSRSNSSIGKRSETNSVKLDLNPFNLVDHTYCPNPNAPKSSTVGRPPSDEIFTVSDSSSNASKDISDTVREGESTKDRSESAGSNDSISNELCHFKPILSCPRTPPRKMADGKLVDPPVVRTTPRNLSRNGFGSPAGSPGLEPGSPIMQRRLSELAQERQLFVQERSKSTSTRTVPHNLRETSLAGDVSHTSAKHHDTEDIHSVPNPHNLRDSSLAGHGMCRPPLHGEHKTGLGSSSGLLIPLEPVLEDHGDFDDTVLLNIKKPSHSNEISTSKSPLHAISPSVDRNKRSRHNSKDAKALTPNQRSIRDWFKTENRSESNSADLFEDHVELIPLDNGRCGVDSGAGGEGAIVDSDLDQEDVTHKKKGKRHKVTSEGDAAEIETQKQKSNGSRNRRRPRAKFDIDSDGFVSDEDVSLKERNGGGSKRKPNKSAKTSDEHLASEDELEGHRDHKFIHKVDTEIAFLSDSEVSFSEGECSTVDEGTSPARKSPRKRRPKDDEDFEFDLDTLDMSDPDMSFITPVKRTRKGKKTLVDENGAEEHPDLKKTRHKRKIVEGPKFDSDHSDDDFVSKTVRKANKGFDKEDALGTSEEDSKPQKQKVGKKNKKSVSDNKTITAVGDSSEEECEVKTKKARRKMSKTVAIDEKVVSCEDNTSTRESKAETLHDQVNHKRKNAKKLDHESLKQEKKPKPRKGKKKDETYKANVSMSSDSEDGEVNCKTKKPAKEMNMEKRRPRKGKIKKDEGEDSMSSDSDEAEVLKSRTRKHSKQVETERGKTRKGKKKTDEDGIEEESSDSGEEEVIKGKARKQTKEADMGKGKTGKGKKKTDDGGMEEESSDSDEEAVIMGKARKQTKEADMGKGKTRKRRKARHEDIEESMSSESEEEVTRRRIKRKSERDKAEGTEEPKQHKQSRKRKAPVETGQSTSESTACAEKPSRRGRNNISKTTQNEGEDLSEAESVKSLKEKPKKASPKKQSPKKTSPKKSPPKKERPSDKEAHSPWKKRRTKLKEEESSQMGLKRCATEELLEENVDPNTNRNNSSSAPTQSKGRRRTRKEISDTSSSCETGQSPKKRVHIDMLDCDDVFESPSKTPSRKQKQKAGNLKSKGKTPVSKKGRNRHASKDQRSIVQFLSGASDADMRQDLDEELASDTTEGFTQEEEDRKIALKLQKQFNLEQRFRMNAERFKGGTEQYQFRRKPKYVD